MPNMKPWFGLALLLLLPGCGGAEKESSTRATVNAQGTLQKAIIQVEHGYNPNTIMAEPGIPLQLVFRRREDPESCAKDLEFPSLNITASIPNNESYTIDIPPQKAGTTVDFRCTMDMMHGKIVVQPSS